MSTEVGDVHLQKEPRLLDLFMIGVNEASENSSTGEVVFSNLSREVMRHDRSCEV